MLFQSSIFRAMSTILELLCVGLCLEVISWCTGSPHPVKNFTTITLYTDQKTWNEAAQICEEQGGRILDITYYSMLSTMLIFASESPWHDIPRENGPPAWIGLHRRVTPLGDLYYSRDCQRLKDFKVVYWNTYSPYTVMDGDPDTFCVYHQIYKSTSNQVTSIKNDYTRANCNEQHMFYCLTENGSCTFEMVPGYYGDTSFDFTPSNDEVHPYKSDEQCAELCLNSWSIYPHPDLRVVEECWGFTTSATECRLHNVLKPSYFDIPSNKISSSSTNLFIKRCFASAINTEQLSVQENDSVFPNTTCGTLSMGSSTVTPLQVSVYLGKRTWNEAFSACRENGHKLLQIQHPDNYTALQQLVDKYAAIQRMDYVWLGFHIPDPINHTNIRVWSDCSVAESSNWNLESPLPTDITDTSLCTVLHTSSHYWYPAVCNEQNYFICIGDYGTRQSYSNGISNTVGSENSLGLYNVTESSCRDMCSTLTYENQECWGYAVLGAAAAEGLYADCVLYFVNSSSPNTPMETSVEPYTLFVKMTWSDTILNNTYVADLSLVPKSCCNVSNLKSECPENNPASYRNMVPTTRRQEFVLYRSTATWNEALTVCQASGGTLVQLDDESKRLMLQRYIDEWTINGYISAEIWIGLTQFHHDDPCSFRWAGACSRPAWTDFQNDSLTDFSSNYCTAVDKNLKYLKRSCNQKHQFVCEINTGFCDIREVVPDINCNLGPRGALLTVSGATCLTDCRTMLYNDMECWAAVMINPNNCNLMFYVDPEYCKDDSEAKKGYDVYFKTCYTASVLGTFPGVPLDDSIYPKTSCSDLIPDEIRTASCSVATLSTASYSASSYSLSSYLLHSVSASSTTLVQPVSISTHSLDVSLTSKLMFNSVSTSNQLVFTSEQDSVTASTTFPLVAVSSLTTAFHPVSNTVLQLSTTPLSYKSATASQTPVQQIISSLSPVSQSPSVAVVPSEAPLSSSAFQVISPSLSTPVLQETPLMLQSALEVISSSTLAIVAQVTTSLMPYSLTPPALGLTVNPSVSPMTSTEISLTSTNAVSTETLENSSVSVPRTEWAKPIFIWPCMCSSTDKTNMTTREWHEWFILMNTIDRYNTSRYRRKLNSVKDHRTSSIAIGMVGSSFLIASAVCLILIDIRRIFRSAVYIHRDSKKTKQLRQNIK